MRFDLYSWNNFVKILNAFIEADCFGFWIVV